MMSLESCPTLFRLHQWLKSTHLILSFEVHLNLNPTDISTLGSHPLVCVVLC